MEESYSAIEFFSDAPGKDEYDLLKYLAEIWPSYLETLTVRLIPQGRAPMVWSREENRFVLEAPASLSHHEPVATRADGRDDHQLSGAVERRRQPKRGDRSATRSDDSRTEHRPA